jgi:HEAT repeat protein
MRPNLREWLEHLRGLQDSDRARQYFDYWWGEVLPDFFDACRNSLREDSEVAREWLDWLRGDARALINPVVGGQAGWQYAWLETILETTLLLAKRGQWTSSETSDSLIADIPRPPCSSSPPFPSAFWRDLAASLSGIYSAYRSRGHVLFPLVLKGGPKPAVLARFRLELLPFGSGEVFLSPGQAPLRCLEEDFSLTFRQAALAARRLLPADSDPGDVRVSIEPFESTDEAYLWNRPLKGPSAGGALALGLWSLWQAVPLDTGLAVSFALSEQSSDPPDGACHPVGGDIEKAKGCLQRGLRTLLVAAGQREELDAWGSELGFSVVRAKTVKQAAEAASGIARQLKVYYEALIEQLDSTPWRHKDGRAVGVRDIAIPVQVLMEERREAAPGRQEEPARRYMDPEVARYSEEPALDARKHLVKWQEEQGRVQRAAILGAPGGGKSFLTALTAISLAEQGLQRLQEGRSLEELPFPVHLDLTDLARTLDSGNEDPEAALLGILHSQSPREELSPPFWSWLGERLRAGQGWLILDALDQVSQERRPALHSWLQNLENQRWLCRRILTCRTPNYDPSWLPWRQVKEYELAPFEPRDIRCLIDRWFEGDQDKASSLKTTLDLSFSLAHACRSPLITTLVCLVHEEQPLPEETRRRDLYNQALRLLLKRGWQARGESWSESDLDERLWVLERLAWDLFPRQPEANQFGHRDVLQALQQALKVLGLSAAPDQLRNDLLKSGILVEAGLDRRGQACFSFLHRSFLEYLAARALADKASGEGWTALADLVDRKAWHPAWQGVILFLAGELENPAPLLELLADENKDDYFRHRLALAARCLPEVTIPPSQHPLSSIADSITTAAYLLWWNDQPPGRAGSLFRSFGALAAANRRVKDTPVLQRLCMTLNDSQYDQRMRATQALEAMGAAAVCHHGVTQAVVDRLLRDPSWQVRRGAAEALRAAGELAARHPGVVPALLDRLQHDYDDGLPEEGRWREYDSVACVCGYGLATMGHAAAQHPDVAPALIRQIVLHGDPQSRLLGGGEVALSAMCEEAPTCTTTAAWQLIRSFLREGDWEIRARAAHSLAWMGAAAAEHDEVVPALVDRLLLDEIGEVRLGAVSALGQLGERALHNPGVVSALLVRLIHDDDHRVRREAAEVLGKTMSCAWDIRDDVIPALLDRLIRDDDPSVRGEAAEVLGEAMSRAGDIRHEVIPALVDRVLNDRDASATSAAAAVLGHAGPAAADYPEVTQALLELALNAEEPWVSQVSAEALAGVARSLGQELAVVAELVDRTLRNDWGTVRENAARVLQVMRAAASYEPAIPALLERLAGDEWPTVRRTAAEALGAGGEVATRCPGVVPALLNHLLSEDTLGRPEHHTETIRAVGQAAEWHTGVLPALLNGLGSGNPLVRERAAASLGAGRAAAADIPDVVPALLDRLRHDSTWYVREQAALALASMGEAFANYPGAVSALIDWLLHLPPMGAVIDVHLPPIGLLTDDVEAALCSLGERAACQIGVVPALVRGLCRRRESDMRYRSERILQRFLLAGVRVFRTKDGKWTVRAVSELSGEASASKANPTAPS